MSNQNPAMNYGARLKSARKAAGMTQTALAKAAGLKGQSLIGNLETGGQQGTTFNSRIAEVLGVNPVWLETGTGQRTTAEEPRPPGYIGNADDESRLLRAYRLASPELRRSLMRLADGILEDLDNPSQLTGNSKPGPG